MGYICRCPQISTGNSTSPSCNLAVQCTIGLFSVTHPSPTSSAILLSLQVTGPVSSVFKMTDGLLV
jgi:hypothetical protein